MDNNKLDEYSESLLALGLLGYDFRCHAASKLLVHHGLQQSTYYWILISALNRLDIDRARQFIKDWSARSKMPIASISRFIPGDHWHVLGTKFDTMEDARKYLQSRGYRLGDIIEKHVYNTLGD